MQITNKNNVILTLCTLALVVLCFASVYSPMRFEERRKAREALVMERLTRIGRAEKAYMKAHGTYAPDLKTLTASGLIADSLTFIPYSEGERFALEASVETEKSGKVVNAMECGAQYQQYLKGLNENDIANLIEEANKRGEYPGMKIDL